MKVKQTARSGGFTIIETLVYLAIAGVLFFITIFYLGGKQRSTQFRQGMRDFESTLNDISNDTATGVFPSFTDIECINSTGSIDFQSPTLPDPNNPVRPGENNDCLFIGNVVQLTHAEPDQPAGRYYMHTLVGKNDRNARSFADTDPIVIYKNGVIDATETFDIPWGVTVKRAYAIEDDGVTFTPINGLAYLYANFGESLSSGSNIKTGVASVSLFVREDGQARTLNEYRSDLNHESNPTAQLLMPLGGRIIHICLDDNDSRQAMIEIGGAAGSFVARTNFNPSAECLA